MHESCMGGVRPASPDRGGGGASRGGAGPGEGPREVVGGRLVPDVAGWLAAAVRIISISCSGCSVFPVVGLIYIYRLV